MAGAKAQYKGAGTVVGGTGNYAFLLTVTDGKVYVTCFDAFGDERHIEQVVVTVAAGGGPAHQMPVRRLDPGRFVADVELQPGRNTIAAVARASDGTRLRAAVALDVPGG